ncbi:MAG: hypothetical protein IKH72_02300 [Firmicutes bacterium]|nr:hypothetical protein [Bacillota bacterium]
MKDSYIKDCTVIPAGGINYLETLEGTDRWRWGMDYTDGDLYEAEDLYRDGHEIRSNRLIFVSYPEGKVYEPVNASEGQYLGRPVWSEDSIFCLSVDFKAGKIYILRCCEDMSGAESVKELPLDEVKDCYNLMLDTEPLTLVRQGHENDFQVVWPEKGDFGISPTESFYFRDGDCLIFSKWYEDPYYREETVIRAYPSGEVLEEIKGAVIRMPDGQKWMLE